MLCEGNFDDAVSQNTTTDFSVAKGDGDGNGTAIVDMGVYEAGR